MRDSKRAELTKYILDEYRFNDFIPNIGNWKKVLDGGLLLHKIPWQADCTFESILDPYVSCANYMIDNIDVIFDGYLDSNAKGHCHIKRNSIQSNEIRFSSNILLDCLKELFLSISSNEQSLVSL